MGLQLSGYRLGSDTLTQFYEDIFRFVIILQTILTISWWGEAGLQTILRWRETRLQTILRWREAGLQTIHRWREAGLSTIVTTIIWRKKTTLTSIIC